VLLVAAWLAGVLLGLYIDADLLPLLLLLLAALPLGLLLRIAGRSAWPAVVVGIGLLALLRVEATDAPPAPLVTTDGQPVTLRGRIVSDPESTARKVKFVLAVAAIDRGDGWQPLRWDRRRSLVYADPPVSLLSTGEAPYFHYGDSLLLQGVLKEPERFSGFDYPAYLANQNIHGILWSRQVELVSREGGIRWRGWMFELRGRLAASLEDALPPTHSALAEALLLGVRGRLPPEVVVDFRNTGTSHLLAISGLNVAILLVPALAVAGWWLGRRRQIYLLLPLASIWFYALVSGLSVSVVRAAIMASVFLGALAVGRPRSALPALALSAAVMAAIDPGALRQVSLQLSFTAVAGIALSLPYHARIRETVTLSAGVSGLWWQRWSRFLASWVLIALVVSAAATLATLPLVAFNFHQIPLFGIFATMLALPMLPFMLLGSLLAAVGGLIAPSLGQFFGWLAWPPLSYLLGLVSLTPGPTVSGAWVGPPLVWVWYILMGGVLIVPGAVSYLKGLSSRLALRSLAAPQPSSATLSLLGLFLILTVAAILLWVQVFSGPDGKLHVYFFDVGQGDSILIVTPTGRQVLVDGGPEAESATRALAGPLSPWDRSLDMVVLTHLDADHSQGLLKVLDRYRVAAVVMGRAESRPMGASPPTPSPSPMERGPGGEAPQWKATVERRQLRVTPVSAGYRIMLEPEVALEVLNPPLIPFRGSQSDDNNNGVVLRLVYGDVRFLLAADIEALAEEHLVRHVSGLESQVLKVAHHGSKTSTTAGFLQRVSPSYAVISAGAENRYGHPHPQVIARLSEQPGLAGIYQTAQQGSIEFISDGQRFWVKTQR
jgi:competence protein ComEC